MGPKKLSWLHISDAHFKESDIYSHDVVLKALLDSIKRFKSRDLKPDLVFFTGDIALSGKKAQYALASEFFVTLLKELCLDKDALFVIPGNHDVDRSKGVGLKRTLDTPEEANSYFEADSQLLHIVQRQNAFLEWYSEFFAGTRHFETKTTCGPYVTRTFGDFEIGIIPVNTAVFCLADDDAGRLWVGRRCLDDFLNTPRKKADLTIALMHHPLDWLNEQEKTQVTSLFYKNVDCILRGHLHQTELSRTDGTSGSALHLAAGACYQGASAPNKAMFVEVYDEFLRVVPIKFEDLPSPLWTLDTSIYPDNDDFSGKLQWRSGREEPRTSMGAKTVGKSVPTIPLWEHAIIPVKQDTSEDLARKNFEQDLFINSQGSVLYVEPRLSRVSQNLASHKDDGVEFVTVAEVVRTELSYIINVPSEHGGTSLSKRLALELVRNKRPIELRDALSLPGYRAKLRSEFSDVHSGVESGRTLILDNYNHHRHERLIREIRSLNLFHRFILLTTSRKMDFDVPSSTIGDRVAEILFVWPMSRSGVREMAAGLMDSADNTYLSNVVEKVYGDLLSLSIPLTPSNVVMYLKVLAREFDFYPFNRVDIVKKYLESALSGSGELLSGSFTSREKMGILSEFSYSLFSRSAAYFVEAEWFDFCRNYMKDTLSTFSAKDLLRALEECRILIRYDDRIYFKYAFFLSFLVALHISNHPEMLKPFLTAPTAYSLYGVTETIAGLVGDGTQIIDHITSDLEAKLEEFGKLYVPFEFDPMSKAEWADSDNDEGMWESISQEVERGPVSVTELDLIRTSFSREAKTIDQQVRYSQLRQLQYEVFRTATILTEALKEAHSVRGSVKKRAIISCLRTDQIGMQIGAILAPEMAKREWLQWGGAIFIGFNRVPTENGDQYPAPMDIATAIVTSVTDKAAEDLGCKKLGEVFKAINPEQDPESFMSLLVFSCLVRSKPLGWEELTRQRIEKINRKAFYLSEMLEVVMREYKAGINTQAEREVLKRLIATIYAKRSLNKDKPGSKIVKAMLHKLENVGVLNDSGGDDD